jgi:Uncharacterized conserved protein
MPVVGAFAVPHPPLILPEVGRGEEKLIQSTIDAYREAMRRAAALKPETVVVTTPHTVLYGDYFHISPGAAARGDMARFDAPAVRMEVPYDTALVSALSRLAEESGIPAGTLGERDPALDHATLIPLRFLNEFCAGFQLVRIGLSGLSPLSHYRLGMCIGRAAEELDRRVVVIASGDLSHKLTRDGPYGFAPEGPEFDRRTADALSRGDFWELLRIPPALADAAAECGLRSFQIMAGTLDAQAVSCELLSHEGPFGVGYAVASFIPTGRRDERRRFAPRLEEAAAQERAQREAQEDPWVRLARLSLETWVKTGKRAGVPEGLPPALQAVRAGAFVSLKKDGRLRGCIGTISPAAPTLAQEILENAVSAGTRDPRFPPVTREELPELVYSVDVLGAPEPVSSPAELDVKRYGVIVSAGKRRGLLLPDLAGVDTVEEQIDIARQKAGIAPETAVTLERFEVVRHH